jgi:hypothetical protein
MSRAERKQAEPQRRVPRTKAGEEITSELAETLASEAEQGYDLSKAKRRRVKESAPRAQDPIAARLAAAPYDDEGLTDEDLRAVKEARSHRAFLGQTPSGAER